VGSDGSVYENTSANRSGVKGAERLGPHTWRIPMDSYSPLGYTARRVFEDEAKARKFANEAEYLARNPDAYLRQPSHCAGLANRAALGAGLTRRGGEYWKGTGTAWMGVGRPVSGGSGLAAQLAAAEARVASLEGGNAMLALAVQRQQETAESDIRRLEAAIKDPSQLAGLAGWFGGKTPTPEDAQRQLDQRRLAMAQGKGLADYAEELAEQHARAAEKEQDAAEAAAEAARAAREAAEERQRAQQTAMQEEIELARVRADLAATPGEGAMWDDEAISAAERYAEWIKSIKGETLEYYQALADVKRMREQAFGSMTRGQELLAASVGGGGALQSWLRRQGGGEMTAVDAPPAFDWAGLRAHGVTRGDAPEGGAAGVLSGGVRQGILDSGPALFAAVRDGAAAGLRDVAGRIAMG